MMPNNHCEFSSCRRYRYTLWRVWNESKPYCMFIGLNPSTADETEDDPTVRRCIQFSKDWGYGALCMTNLFAWRETDPKLMKHVPDPVGEGNDFHLQYTAEHAGIIIAAWGSDGRFKNRGAKVKTLIPNLHCLRVSEKTGQPMHPLYQPGNLKPIQL